MFTQRLGHLIKHFKSICPGFFILVLSGCTVVKVVDVAASTAIGTVKTTGKVVGAVVPDGDDDEDE